MDDQINYMILIQPKECRTGGQGDHYYYGLNAPVASIAEANVELTSQFSYEHMGNLWLAAYIELPNIIAMTPIYWNGSQHVILESHTRYDIGEVDLRSFD